MTENDLLTLFVSDVVPIGRYLFVTLAETDDDVLCTLKKTDYLLGVN